MTDSPLPGRLAPAASRRWIVVLALSILLHVLLLGWGSDSLRWPAPHATPQRLLKAALLAPPASAPAPSARPASAPAHAPQKSRPRARAKPVPAATAITPEPVAPEAVAAPDRAYPSADESLRSAPLIEAGIERAGATPAMADAATKVSYRVDPPPSARLKYEVEALRQGQRVYGHGSIAWSTNGDSYRIDGDAGILFFSLLSFKSEGLIDEFGVAPVLYNEQRFRRSATNTHFQRERQLISFSASTASYPRQGGEQDRASVIWQLAGIGRADAGRFIAGADLDLFVAGVRDAETWRIHIIDQEQIDLDGRPTLAWHVVRVPRPGSYDQRIDIWLAPEREWYPVKLRYTETNGNYLDLLLSAIQPRQVEAHAPAVEQPAANLDWIN